MPGKVPADKLAEYYIKYSDVTNYKELSIKNDTLTNNLKELLKDKYFNIIEIASQLEEKNKIEHVKNYIVSWCHNIPLLTNTKPIKIINVLSVSDFYNYKFQGENVQRTEKNYIEQYNAIINKILPEYKNQKNLNFFVSEHLKIFYSCLKYRSENKQSLDSFKNDLKIIVKFLKLMLDEKHELNIKYSVLLSSLSKIIEYKEKFNLKSSVKEQKNNIDYLQILKKQEEINIEFDKADLDIPINKRRNNTNLLILNMRLLLISFYSLFPPLRGELYDIKIIKNEEDKDTYENTIFIKDNKNIILFLNGIKKKHDPIKINLNDPVIKSFMGSLPDRLINIIFESVQQFPREWLFINTKYNKSSVDTLRDYNNSFFKDENLKLDVPTYRSAFISYYWDKINRNQKDRLISFMRTSSKYSETNYFKVNNLSVPEEIKNINIVSSEYNKPEPKKNIIQELKALDINELIKTKQKQEQEQENKQIIIKERAKRITDEQKIKIRDAKNQYLKEYYKENKEKLLNKAKEYSKNNYGLRLVKELNNNIKDIETVKPQTLDKWQIKFNNKTNEYYI